MDSRARKITMGMKLKAAEALANAVRPEELSAEYIIPSVFNKDVAPRVAAAVSKAAEEEGVSRRVPPSLR